MHEIFNIIAGGVSEKKAEEAAHFVLNFDANGLEEMEYELHITEEADVILAEINADVEQQANARPWCMTPNRRLKPEPSAGRFKSLKESDLLKLESDTEEIKSPPRKQQNGE